MLSRKKRYLQIALNSNLDDAFRIISQLPISDRIIIEAGTPLVKTYGTYGIKMIYNWWSKKVLPQGIDPYIVADLKCMDRGETEVSIAKEAGASAVVALGLAPVETINLFIETCVRNKIDSFLDMMNVDQPIKVLRNLKKPPDVVVLHRGVDETEFNKSKPIPYIQINKVLSSYNTLIAIAGGDTSREVQRAIFNGAGIVIVWKEFYQADNHTGELADKFLRNCK